MEIFIEVANHLLPRLLTLGYIIESGLHVSRKIEIDHRWEVINQEVGNYFGDTRRN